MFSSNVCLLTPRQAHQLEVHGLEPSCRQHRHISKAQAEALIADAVTTLNDAGKWTRLCAARWLGAGKRRLVFMRAREWRRTPSGDNQVRVLQLVPGGGAW
jgi:hypothetical protein